MRSMNDASKNMIKYRAATKNDFPVLMEMYTKLNRYFYTVGYQLPHPEDVGQAWLDSFKRTLGRFSNVFIAEMDNQPVGFVLCRIKRLPQYMNGILVGEISDIWVEKRGRHLGLGTKLLMIAIGWMQEQNVHSIEAQVLRDNIPSQKLFEHMGFQLEYRAMRLLLDNPSDNDA